jgi:hypothetical protein
MTRLEILCKAHNQQGGTIFQFEKLYKLDLLNLSEKEFRDMVNDLNANIRWCDECNRWEEK